MKLLIAGGAGFIGSVLVPKLVERGYDVTVVDQCWFGADLPDSVHLLRKNIFDLHPSDLEGIQQVVFLAGLSNDPMAEYDPSENFISNAATPAYLGYIARQAGVRRLVYACSCSVYGYAVDRFFNEADPAVSDYPYGISKLQGEMSLMQMVNNRFSVISLRKGTVCGYSPRMRLDLIVNTMFKTAMTEGIIRVNNPAIWRPILGIQDAVGGYIRALESNEDVSGVFNLASANYTVGEVAGLVKDRLEQLSVRTLRMDIQNKQDFRNYKVSCKKAEQTLSFKPKQDIADIVDELYAHREEYGDMEQDRYYNIRVFKKMHEEA